ncbi:MAG: DUF3472 domain-containing protein [Prevotellaceae bacterium]|jgi:hypothetical protein|nr:DUF3472 domain-containing protein [Prevotellaceae bacterium]
MKKLFKLFLLGCFTAFYSNANSQNAFFINAGHGYAEPYTAGDPGIQMREKRNLHHWTDLNRKAVWYLYQTAGKYDMSFVLKCEKTKDYAFGMKVSACYDSLDFEPQDFSFVCNAVPLQNDDRQISPCLSVTINKTGYYRYELTAKSDMNGFRLDQLCFKGVGKASTVKGFDTHATDYLSSPSVHLSFSTTAPTSKRYNWLYGEILVPEGCDPLYTYYMSLGFFRGYMGIQTNSETERRVLFSAWDAADRDKYPNAPKEMLVSLVDKAEYVQANDFGNEGTGGQSYVGKGKADTWKTGKPVKFLMNCRHDGGIVYKGDSIKHSVISAWYDAGEGWRYIASWRCPVMPKGKDMFDGFYSFIENYGYRNGQIFRKAYYYNTFGRDEKSGAWQHFNKVRFSNTDGKEGQRIDYEQGVAPEAPDKFYMSSAGYKTTVKTGTEVPLIENFPYLRNLDLKPFESRVNKALKAEKKRKLK